MRIAYVINSVEGGGAASPIPAVTGVMRAQGADVRVFALTARDARALAPIEAAGLPAIVRDGGERDHLRALRWLDTRVGEWRPDILWTSLTRATLLGQIVGRRRGVPVVSWQHNAYLKPANRMLLRRRQHRSALWIADSQAVAELTRMRLGVEADRLMTWPLFRADPHAPRAAPWRSGEAVRIGSLGRLHAAKGYDVLIAALARVGGAPTRFEVEIAGEGAERARLEAAIRAAGLANVRLTGFAVDPRAFLAGLHLYVQPSRREGLCIAAHEAMQAGLPTIVARTGEMPHSVAVGVSGSVVDPENADALAGAIAELLRAPHRLAARGEAARRRVLARFGPDAFDAAGAAILARLPAIAAA